MPIETDVVVLGAGAAGMYCAIEAGRRGRSVAIIDHAKAPGEKIRISGGGRCNFTNIDSGPKNFLSNNPRFAISALKRHTAQDFVDRVAARGIPFHEKALGQLFCDRTAKDIIQMLRDDMADAGVAVHLQTTIEAAEYRDDRFQVATSNGLFKAQSLIVATGGKSIPKMGATGLGYDLAEQFGHAIVATRPALVPFTWPSNLAEDWATLSGVSLPVCATCMSGRFDEAMLITHRGLSGPAILQISSYWCERDTVTIDLMPRLDVDGLLKGERQTRPKTSTVTVLSDHMPKRLVQKLARDWAIDTLNNADLSNRKIADISQRLHQFKFAPGGTEGYRTAEVTLGGVDTDGLNQKTMESLYQPGLYFIGEVVDVTGHLGGHNFQWAWSSGYAAGRAA